MNIAEFGSDLDRARDVVAYLTDLGINAIEIMPLSNVGNSVDWAICRSGTSESMSDSESDPTCRP